MRVVCNVPPMFPIAVINAADGAWTLVAANLALSAGVTRSAILHRRRTAPPSLPNRHRHGVHGRVMSNDPNQPQPPQDPNAPNQPDHPDDDRRRQRQEQRIG